MSAGITKTDNMFSVAEVPRHKLGRVILISVKASCAK